jgi:hypothetical protein
MQKKSLLSGVVERAVLESILPYVSGGDTWAEPLLLLGRVSSVIYQNHTGKEKKPKCQTCGAIYDNFLLLVLHIELVHRVFLSIVRARSKSKNTSFHRTCSPSTSKVNPNHLSSSIQSSSWSSTVRITSWAPTSRIESGISSSPSSANSLRSMKNNEDSTSTRLTSSEKSGRTAPGRIRKTI